MACKDIPDFKVILAAQHAATVTYSTMEVLQALTEQPEKVCSAAIMRACGRGFVDYGTSHYSCWITENGAAVLEKSAGAEYHIIYVENYDHALMEARELGYDRHNIKYLQSWQQAAGLLRGAEWKKWKNIYVLAIYRHDQRLLDEIKFREVTV